MSTPYQERPLAAPVIDAATEPFWQGTREGRFRLKRCTDCDQVHWYPRSLCPYCMGETEWVTASGRGEIYSVTVTRRGSPVPYALAYVRLAEGVTVLTNIVDCDLDTLAIGTPVELTFKDAEEDGRIPMFRPVDAAL